MGNLLTTDGRHGDSLGNDPKNDHGSNEQPEPPEPTPTVSDMLMTCFAPCMSVDLEELEEDIDYLPSNHERIDTTMSPQMPECLICYEQQPTLPRAKCLTCEACFFCCQTRMCRDCIVVCPICHRPNSLLHLPPRRHLRSPSKAASHRHNALATDILIL